MKGQGYMAPTQRSAQTHAFVPYDRVKRLGDIVLAGGALVALSPLILGTGLVVRATLGPDVLFRQPRPGRDGRVFEMLKFRTMHKTDEKRGRVSDEERMTSMGTFLRAASLDELPSLLNVLRGDMSLVGPRPLLVEYLDRYTEEQARRHEVLPGLTGLAQVSGRNSLTWDAKFALDVEYVEACSLKTDLQILLATVPKVFRREGIQEEGHVTMTVFYGPRRIGDHEVRRVSGSHGERWEILDHRSGDVVAHGELMPAAEGEWESRLQVVPGSREPELVRSRGETIMAGLACELREEGAVSMQEVALR